MPTASPPHLESFPTRENGHALPASWYTDPAILALERERIFKHAWQFAGLLEDVAEAGDYITCMLGGQIPVVVVRDKAGQLNAFLNVCRHRGALIATDAHGRVSSLQCPYHAWTYGLDGSLRAAPRSEREPDFNRSELGLLRMQVDTWGPCIFVNPDPSAAPLLDWLGPIPEIYESSGLDLSSLVRRGRVEFEHEVNWKLIPENFVECYHCPTVHKTSFATTAVVNQDEFLLTGSNYAFMLEGRLRDEVAEGKQAPPYDVHGEIERHHFCIMWPNTGIQIMPGAANLSLFWWTPISPTRSYAVVEFLFSEDVDDKFEADLKEFLQVIGEEDFGAMESVQRGLNSGLMPPGQLLPHSEHLILRYQDLVYDAVTE